MSKILKNSRVDLLGVRINVRNVEVFRPWSKETISMSRILKYSH